MRDYWQRHPRAWLVFEFVFGALALLVAFGGWLADHDLSARGVRGTAEVVEVLHGKDPQYVVRFTLSSGRIATERTAYATRGAHVGEVIRVEYDPEDPSTVAQVGSRSGAWILYGGWGLVGLGLIGHAFWKVWRRRGSPSGDPPSPLVTE
jgi:hypothetical protein